ncbi:MAG: glycine cleavage system protein GcvH [Bdellovibrionales bacterium]|nr:glycine cleavage system protein GcvH [Bdellovibrionales bacterium]
MEFPGDLKYTKDHEWVRVEGDSAVVGITEFAQEELGEIVFVELPPVGSEFKAGDTLCVVESTKAASDVYAPISGKIAAVNDALGDSPDKVNSSPYSDGWMVKFEGIDAAEIEALMDSATYQGVAQS